MRVGSGHVTILITVWGCIGTCNCSCTGILQLDLATGLYRQVSGVCEKPDQQLKLLCLSLKYETF